MRLWLIVSRKKHTRTQVAAGFVFFLFKKGKFRFGLYVCFERSLSLQRRRLEK